MKSAKTKVPAHAAVGAPNVIGVFFGNVDDRTPALDTPARETSATALPRARKLGLHRVRKNPRILYRDEGEWGH